MEEEQKQNTQQAKEEHTATSPKHISIPPHVIIIRFLEQNKIILYYADISLKDFQNQRIKLLPISSA